MAAKTPNYFEKYLNRKSFYIFALFGTFSIIIILTIFGIIININARRYIKNDALSKVTHATHLLNTNLYQKKRNANYLINKYVNENLNLNILDPTDYGFTTIKLINTTSIEFINNYSLYFKQKETKFVHINEDQLQAIIYPIYKNDVLVSICVFTFELSSVLATVDLHTRSSSYIVNSNSNIIFSEVNDFKVYEHNFISNIIKNKSGYKSKTLNNINQGIKSKTIGVATYNSRIGRMTISYSGVLESPDSSLVLVISHEYYMFDDYYKTATSINYMFLGIIFGVLFFYFTYYTKDVKKGNDIHDLIFTDQLTGGFSYKYFCIKAQQIVQKTIGKHMFLLEIDIENFSLINNHLGYDNANEVLKSIYNLIQSNIKENDVCCRKYADIYTVLLTFETYEEAMVGFNDLIEKIKIPLSDYEYGTYPAMGIYEITDRTTNIETMGSYANMALQTVRNRVDRMYAFYKKEMGEQITQEKQLSEEIIKGFEREEFLVYFQPKVDALKEKVVGAEALVRWNSNGKFISPGIFIPIAEKNLFIKKIDYFVLESVIKKQIELLSNGVSILPISVNVSKETIHEPKFVDNIKALFDKYQLNPKHVSLEITETSAFSNHIQNTIDELKSLGFVILLDDFGVGYAAFNVLNDIKFDVLKIDKSFIDNCLTREGYIMLKGVIEIARALDLVTVAEGVETKEQCEIVKKIGCAQIQGYYFYKPMPFKDYLKVLQTRTF